MLEATHIGLHRVNKLVDKLELEMVVYRIRSSRSRKICMASTALYMLVPQWYKRWKPGEIRIRKIIFCVGCLIRKLFFGQLRYLSAV